MEGLRVRVANTILNLVSVALVGAGLALIATFFVGPAFLNPDVSAGTSSEAFNVPTVEKADKSAAAPKSAAVAKTGAEKPSAYAPKDKSLRLTVPGMSRIRDSAVPRAKGTNEDKLRDNPGIHLEGTGYPWQKGSNVYIAGHRLGYPSTGSFLAFFDLDNLRKGDEVRLTDANGKRYTYRVYKKFIVDPSDVFVTRPVEGKSVVTLQTCTLPDYSQRLIVRAERVA